MALGQGYLLRLLRPCSTVRGSCWCQPYRRRQRLFMKDEEGNTCPSACPGIREAYHGRFRSSSGFERSTNIWFRNIGIRRFRKVKNQKFAGGATIGFLERSA
jgi:hypothetical protein